MDILLEENEETRYEVEVQLGATNPDHIIRTIEYWNNESKRNKDFQHVPVLIAEEITGRFQDVISLFNKAIPIIAIQMTVFKEDAGKYGILFTKILDLSDTDSDDDIGKTFTKEDWEKKSTKDMISLVEKMYNDFIERKDEIRLNYLQMYIGLIENGTANNFISFVPKKKFVKIRFKSIESEEIEKKFDAVGFEINYCSRLGRKDYVVKVANFDEYLKVKSLLKEITNK